MLFMEKLPSLSWSPANVNGSQEVNCPLFVVPQSKVVLAVASQQIGTARGACEKYALCGRWMTGKYRRSGASSETWGGALFSGVEAGAGEKSGEYVCIWQAIRTGTGD